FYCLGRAFVDFNEALKIELNNEDMLILRGEAYLNLELRSASKKSTISDPSSQTSRKNIK
ncbi:7004_t:CDS:2, partial [Racocetra fulgida]